MDKEIINIIEKNLPAQTAGVMRDFINDAELLQEQHTRALEHTAGLQKALDEFKKKEERYQDLESRELNLVKIGSELEARRVELDERDRAFQLELVEAKMESMKCNMKNMEGLVNKVFGHPSVSITRNVPVAEHVAVSDNGQQACGSVMNHHETEEKTETKL